MVQHNCPWYQYDKPSTGLNSTPSFQPTDYPVYNYPGRPPYATNGPPGFPPPYPNGPPPQLTDIEVQALKDFLASNGVVG